MQLLACNAPLLHSNDMLCVLQEKLIIERRMRYAAEHGIPFRCPEGASQLEGVLDSSP